MTPHAGEMETLDLGLKGQSVCLRASVAVKRHHDYGNSFFFILFVWFVVVILFVCFLETRFHCVSLTVLELTL